MTDEEVIAEDKRKHPERWGIPSMELEGHWGYKLHTAPMTHEDEVAYCKARDAEMAKAMAVELEARARSETFAESKREAMRRAERAIERSQHLLVPQGENEHAMDYAERLAEATWETVQWEKWRNQVLEGVVVTRIIFIGITLTLLLPLIVATLGLAMLLGRYAKTRAALVNGWEESLAPMGWRLGEAGTKEPAIRFEGDS